MIDVRRTQQNLAGAGYSPGAIDGVWGRGTMTALLAHAVGRQADQTLRRIGGVAAVQLAVHGWTETPARLAEWIAETAHETGGYTSISENLNYSAKRLTEVWPSRFPTLASASAYAGNPTALANRVYADRMGNGPEESGDGWRCRGSGLVMHTGASEYDRLFQRLGFDADDVRDWGKAVLASLDFLARAGTMALVDRGDLTGARKSINGGTIGLDDVRNRRARTLQVLA